MRPGADVMTRRHVSERESESSVLGSNDNTRAPIQRWAGGCGVAEPVIGCLREKLRDRWARHERLWTDECAMYEAYHRE
jgi:hypothetical protein